MIYTNKGSSEKVDTDTKEYSNQNGVIYRDSQEEDITYTFSVHIK